MILLLQLIGSSLLFVHDSTKACVWLIDFGKTVPVPNGLSIDHKSPWEVGNHEDGYLIGVQNLINIFSDVASVLSNHGSTGKNPSTNTTQQFTSKTKETSPHHEDRSAKNVSCSNISKKDNESSSSLKTIPPPPSLSSPPSDSTAEVVNSSTILTASVTLTADVSSSSSEKIETDSARKNDSGSDPSS